ncbi:MAG TPA: nuclear transport factor 2 family protein [Pyrinomonadaceae bacterium]|nr:nuclear transport factor 2 family protein [Pyrinomonadaceae bacterium]
MSDKNKEIVKKINESFSAGNTDGFLEHCTDNVVWNMVGDKETKGKAAIKEWMSQMDGMEPPKFSVDKIIAEGVSVICYGEMTMKGEDGKDGKYSYVDAYEFSGDKVADLRSFVVKHKTEEESKKKAA